MTSKQNSEPYFLTFRSSNPEYPLLIFLPSMNKTRKALLDLETKGLEAGFNIRCLVILLDNYMDWKQLTERTIALIQVELERTPQKAVFLFSLFSVVNFWEDVSL